MDEKMRERIKKARVTARLSPADLGRLVGVTEGAVRHWESGFSSVPIERLMGLSKALDLPVSWFLGESPGLSEDEGELIESYRLLGEDEKNAIRLVVRRMAS